MKNHWINKIKQRLELRKYDDFSIGEYFRKQGTQVGENNRIMIRSLGESPRLVSIGNHVTISSGVVFLTHDGAGWIFTDEIPDLQKFGTIQIMDNCFIGIHSMLLPNIIIGPNAVVGAGAIVTKDVKPGTVVAGNPARVVSTVDELKKKIIYVWSRQKIPGYLSDFSDGAICHPKEIQTAKQRERYRLEEHLLSLFRKNGKI